MKFILGRFRVWLAICFVAPVQAVVWTDYQNLGEHIREGGSGSGWFELDSFDPLLHTISKATISFAFSDGRRRGDAFGEWADIQWDRTRCGLVWKWMGQKWAVLTGSAQVWAIIC